MTTTHHIGDKCVLVGITSAGNTYYDDTIKIDPCKDYVNALYTALLKTDTGQYLNFNIIQIKIVDIMFVKDRIRYLGEVIIGTPDILGKQCHTDFFTDLKKVETCNYIWGIPDDTPLYQRDLQQYIKYIDYAFIRACLEPKSKKDIQVKNFIHFVDDILYQNRKKL